MLEPVLRPRRSPRSGAATTDGSSLSSADGAATNGRCELTATTPRGESLLLRPADRWREPVFVQVRRTNAEWLSPWDATNPSPGTGVRTYARHAADLRGGGRARSAAAPGHRRRRADRRPGQPEQHHPRLVPQLLGRLLDGPGERRSRHHADGPGGRRGPCVRNPGAASASRSTSAPRTQPASPSSASSGSGRRVCGCGCCTSTGPGVTTESFAVTVEELHGGTLRQRLDTHNTSHIDDTPPHVRGVADAAP